MVRANGGRDFAAGLGRHRGHRPAHRIQLVRLRQAAAARVHQLAGGVHPVSEPLLPFFQWCESTWLGTAVRDSVWAFPVIESVHLLGLSLLGGSILIVDLRLLGLGLTRQRISDLARAARPWLLASLAVM